MAFTGRNDKYPCHLGTRGNSILVFFFPFLCVYPLTSFSCMETIPPSAQHIKIPPSLNNWHWMIIVESNMHTRLGDFGLLRLRFRVSPINSCISRTYNFPSKQERMKIGFRWRRTIHLSLTVIATFDDVCETLCVFETK